MSLFKAQKSPQNAPKNDFFKFFLHISFYIATEVMYTKFGDPKSILAEFHFLMLKKAKSPQNALKIDFFKFFLHISFFIATEAVYTKFGDPKSIVVEHFFYYKETSFKRIL